MSWGVEGVVDIGLFAGRGTQTNTSAMLLWPWVAGALISVTYADCEQLYSNVL
jgi:hypothetical protein